MYTCLFIYRRKYLEKEEEKRNKIVLKFEI